MNTLKASNCKAINEIKAFSVFAIKEGYYVKESVSTKMTGNLEIPDQNMSFPVVMTVNSTNEIIK